MKGAASLPLDSRCMLILKILSFVRDSLEEPEDKLNLQVQNPEGVMRKSFHILCPDTMLVVLLILAAVIPSCSNAFQVKELSDDYLIILALGEEAAVGQLLICLEGILGDSRCPVDVVCFWEGDGVILVKAATVGAEPVLYPLHTHASFGNEFEYEGYKIALTALDPQPVSDNPIPPDEYRATLFITETSTLSTQHSTWGAIKDLYK